MDNEIDFFFFERGGGVTKNKRKEKSNYFDTKMIGTLLSEPSYQFKNRNKKNKMIN
jgi:hypothetical protein